MCYNVTLVYKVAKLQVVACQCTVANLTHEACNCIFTKRITDRVYAYSIVTNTALKYLNTSQSVKM